MKNRNKMKTLLALSAILLAGCMAQPVPSPQRADMLTHDSASSTLTPYKHTTEDGLTLIEYRPEGARCWMVEGAPDSFRCYSF